MFVLGEDGKTRRLLDAFATDTHSGEWIWESNSELALQRNYIRTYPSPFLLNGRFRVSL
jgi:hypothetical protein